MNFRLKINNYYKSCVNLHKTEQKDSIKIKKLTQSNFTKIQKKTQKI